MHDTAQVTGLLQHGIAAARAGRKEEARQYLLQATDLDERNEQAWLWLSGVVESFEDRRVCLENVLAINPANPHARQGLRWLDEHAPPPAPAAEERCPRCQLPVPSSGAVCPQCDQLLIVACPGCVEYIEVEHPVCPECGCLLGDFRDGAHYHLGLARAYLERERFALAQDAGDRAEAEAPDDPEVLEAVAALHERMGHTDLATLIYQRAIERHPESAIYYARLGAIYDRRAMPDDARAMYEQAVRLDSGDPATLFALAQLYVEEGLLSGASRLLEHVVEVDPEHAEAHLLLSDAYMRLGKSKQAVQLYERAGALSKPGSAVGREVQRRLAKLRPSVSEQHAQGWGETFRRVTGLMLLPVLAAWVNAGVIPPWEIRPAALGALAVAFLASYLWACATDVPRNDIMRAIFGKAGLERLWQKALVGVPGVALWGAALGVIMWRG
jgi:tetratricopeptide (TPR) repeat protein